MEINISNQEKQTKQKELLRKTNHETPIANSEFLDMMHTLKNVSHNVLELLTSTLLLITIIPLPHVEIELSLNQMPMHPLSDTSSYKTPPKSLNTQSLEPQFPVPTYDPHFPTYQPNSYLSPIFSNFRTLYPTD